MFLGRFRLFSGPGILEFIVVKVYNQGTVETLIKEVNFPHISLTNKLKCTITIKWLG